VPKFIVTETGTNYFIIESDHEEQACVEIAYRDPGSTFPYYVDVIGYDTVVPIEAPFDIRP